MSISKRQRRLEAKKVFDKGQSLFMPIDLAKHNHPSWMTRAYKNNHFVVMIDDNCPTTAGNAIRVMVQKHNDTPLINHWATMQSIKNEIFGKETVAIEYYPKESELVDHHNIYWMWIFPDNVIPNPLTPDNH